MRESLRKLIYKRKMEPIGWDGGGGEESSRGFNEHIGSHYPNYGELAKLHARAR